MDNFIKNPVFVDNTEVYTGEKDIVCLRPCPARFTALRGADKLASDLPKYLAWLNQKCINAIASHLKSFNMPSESTIDSASVIEILKVYSLSAALR